MTKPLSHDALKADLLLLTTALVWGLAFVAQRVGAEHMPPLLFNGVRFALGALALLPVVKRFGRGFAPAPGLSGGGRPGVALAGILATGAALTAGVTLQQMGLEQTTAGKAGFVTGLYVILAPILGLAFGRRTPAGTWLGAVLAVAGMYLLCAEDDLTLGHGDLLVLAGAFFWAAHLLTVSWFAPRMNPLLLAVGQYAVCAAVSLAISSRAEIWSLADLRLAIVPVLYGGLVSVGLGYTLQLVAQRRASPSHAAVILSLEAVFAALSGWLILGEDLSGRGIAGCLLMLAGMLACQLLPDRSWA